MQTIARQHSLRPRSTAATVYELLRMDIVLGTLKPSEPIREADIATRLSVSRTPVREALLRLSNLGLVDIFPQSGTSVAPVRREKIHAAQLVREAVEVEVARRACRMAADADLKDLRDILDEQDFAHARNDVRRFRECDEAFHRRIFQAADCLPVAEELEDANAHIHRLRALMGLSWPNQPDTTAAEHRAILAALVARDEEAAAAAVSQHLRAILPSLEALGGKLQ